jgi:putative DNA primase/helicase
MEADQEDFITKKTAVVPADPLRGDGCPLWLDFLNQATQGDQDLIRFMQQIAGYALTGDIREHALFFIYGPGGNGKGVFVNTITKVLGDYATTAAMDTFTASQSDRHPTDLAKLKGARLVTASETEEGRAWAESRIKALTGGDRISARFMRQDFFEFDPAFKLLIVGNHKPVLRNVDEAARRRFNMIPFIHKPERPDKQLEEKLKPEWPGILRWMIDGCLDWQQHGLIRPAVVKEATAEYFSEQDSVHQWIEECCETGGRDISDTTANLFASWTAWATANGEKSGTTKWFNQVLQRQGFEPVRETPNHRGKRGFLRVSVKPKDTSDQWWHRPEDD